MSSIISNYISPESIDSQDPTDGIAANFLNLTIAALANFKNYLFPSTESNLQHPVSLNTMSVHHLTDESLPSIAPPVDISDSVQPNVATNWESSSVCDSTRHPGSFIDEDPKRFFSIQPHDYNQELVSPYEPVDNKHSSLDCNHALSGNLLSHPSTDDPFPEEDMMFYDAPMSIPPESLHCFETASMVYVPGESERLDICAVDIIQESELAHQLGVSGKVKVDKVFYEAGTGAIIAQVVHQERTQSFSLFFIESERNIKFTELQQSQIDKFLRTHKLKFDSIYETFRKRLKKDGRQGIGSNNLLRVFLNKKLPKTLHPEIMALTKQYLCNSDVCSVIDKNGNDISEVIKIRMHQQEEKLASPPEPVRHNNIKSALKDIAQRKTAWAATQRDASRLNIQFDNKPGVLLTAKQAETVKMLKDKRAMAKKVGARASFTAHDVTPHQTSSGKTCCLSFG